MLLIFGKFKKQKVGFLITENLKNFIKDYFQGSAVKVFYYTAYPANGTRDYSIDGKHKFFTFLKKGLDFVVRKKELKRIDVVVGKGVVVEEKGNMDVEMVIDAIHFKKDYDIAVLFSGDSDFLALINYLKNGGKKVYVFSSKNNISTELRTGADGYKDLLKIKESIWGRELRFRPESNK